MLVDSERAISSETAHESALRAIEYLQAGACRSLIETLDAMEKHEDLSSEDRRR